MDNIYTPEQWADLCAEAAVSADLKTALQAFIPTLTPLLPHLRSRQQFLLSYYTKYLVEEITASSVDTHWWEMHLALLTQAAQNQGDAGQPLLQAAARLKPLVQSHFGPHGSVTLVEINEDTVRGICRLSDTLTDPQDLFVAPNAHSLAQAHFNPYAWFRAVYAGKTPVGFMLLYDNDEKPDYYLWRFMIGTPYQGYGYGRDAINLLIEYVRTRPQATELLVGCVLHPQGPFDFYIKTGFISTGVEEHGELILKMPL